jgi:NitT/TauT family transport system permease protein
MKCVRARSLLTSTRRHVTRILAYALAFIAVMLTIETFLVQPLERHVARLHPRPA